MFSTFTKKKPILRHADYAVKQKPKTNRFWHQLETESHNIFESLKTDHPALEHATMTIYRANTQATPYVFLIFADDAEQILANYPDDDNNQLATFATAINKTLINKFDLLLFGYFFVAPGNLPISHDQCVNRHKTLYQLFTETLQPTHLWTIRDDGLYV